MPSPTVLVWGARKDPSAAGGRAAAGSDRVRTGRKL